jgi:hypothetical protein
MQWYRCFYSLLFGLLWIASHGAAQSLHLHEKGTGAIQVQARTGDVVEIEAVADLARYSASGISLYVAIPEEHFEVIGNASGQDGVQPFEQGPLFSNATEMSNQLVPREEMLGLLSGWELLSYTALLGPGAERGRTGSGVVATFRLRCLKASKNCPIQVYGSPIFETLLVLSDGRSEQRFHPGQDLEISVALPTHLGVSKSWGRIKANLTTEDSR